MLTPMEPYERINALTAQLAAKNPDVPALKALIDDLLEELQIDSENVIGCIAHLRTAQAQLDEGAVAAARISLGAASLVIRGGGATES
jgi:hypothetical protein